MEDPKATSPTHLPETAPTPNLCVFCGSRFGEREAYRQAALDTGRLAAALDFGVVYGGGHVGLMGTVADAALEHGATVIGIIPHALDAREVSHHGLTELHLVDDMFERKELMARRSQAYLVLPGGIGTLDELFEAMTNSQLGFDPKPIGLLNVDGYYDSLVRLIDHLIEEGFLAEEHGSLLWVDDDLERLMKRLRQAVAAPTAP